jgi:hypothetical protein
MARRQRDAFETPARDATQRFLDETGRALRWTFDVDLGELCEGHHVVARGISDEPNGAELHYEFVPGLTAAETGAKEFFWYWMLAASDDVGTEYDDSNTGGFSERGGAASHGVRDVGGVVPASATRLTLEFEPASGWTPSRDYVRTLIIDLESGGTITGA